MMVDYSMYDAMERVFVEFGAKVVVISEKIILKLAQQDPQGALGLLLNS